MQGRLIMSLVVLAGGLLMAAGRHEPAHEFHVSYARLAVEGKVGMMQIRLFKDDLETGLGRRFDRPGLVMRADAEMDSLFTSYLNETLVLSQGGTPITGTIAASGEELQNGIPVWWYTVMYEAPQALSDLHIRHDLLMEVFNDQKNVFRVKHFPSEKEWSLYFVVGDSDYDLKLE